MQGSEGVRTKFEKREVSCPLRQQSIHYPRFAPAVSLGSLLGKAAFNYAHKSQVTNNLLILIIKHLEMASQTTTQATVPGAVGPGRLFLSKQGTPWLHSWEVACRTAPPSTAAGPLTAGNTIILNTTARSLCAIRTKLPRPTLSNSTETSQI